MLDLLDEGLFWVVVRSSVIMPSLAASAIDMPFRTATNVLPWRFCSTMFSEKTWSCPSDESNTISIYATAEIVRNVQSRFGALWDLKLRYSWPVEEFPANSTPNLEQKSSVCSSSSKPRYSLTADLLHVFMLAWAFSGAFLPVRHNESSAAKRTLRKLISATHAIK